MKTPAKYKMHDVIRILSEKSSKYPKLIVNSGVCGQNIIIKQGAPLSPIINGLNKNRTYFLDLYLLMGRKL